MKKIIITSIIGMLAGIFVALNSGGSHYYENIHSTFISPIPFVLSMLACFLGLSSLGFSIFHKSEDITRLANLFSKLSCILFIIGFLLYLIL